MIGDPFENVILFIETHDDYDPPASDEDDWQGPEDDDELIECQHRHPSSRCRNCAETYG